MAALVARATEGRPRSLTASAQKPNALSCPRATDPRTAKWMRHAVFRRTLFGWLAKKAGEHKSPILGCLEIETNPSMQNKRKTKHRAIAWEEKQSFHLALRFAIANPPYRKALCSRNIGSLEMKPPLPGIHSRAKGDLENH